MANGANGNGNGGGPPVVPPPGTVLAPTPVSLATSTATATGGAGAVEFYRWAFMGFPLPPPESVLMILAVATVPFAHVLGKGVLAALTRWFPGDTPADTDSGGASQTIKPTASPPIADAKRPWPEGSAR